MCLIGAITTVNIPYGCKIEQKAGKNVEMVDS